MVPRFLTFFHFFEKKHNPWKRLLQRMIRSTTFFLNFFSLLVISSASNVDDQWMKYLEDPPEKALKRYSELSERADVLVRENISSFVLEGREVDVVISGGANYDAYYLGVAQVFSRVNLTQVRFAGASAGTTISLSLSL